MTGRIIYSPRAEEQLDNLDEWISTAASPAVAQQFVSAVLSRIDSILGLPARRNAARRCPPGHAERERTVIACR